MFIEQAHGRLNVVYYCERAIPQKAKFFTMLGFGATLLPSQFVVKKHSWYQVDEKKICGNFDKNLKALKLAKSLDIRTSLSGLDLAVITEFRSLRSLRLKVNLDRELDLANLRDLEMLYGELPSLQKITGLRELPKLKFIAVSQLKKAWFDSLPNSVERLFLTGALNQSIDLSRLPNLNHLGIANARSVDFAKYSWVAPKIVELDLTSVSTLVNADKLRELTPNLKTVNFRGDNNDFLKLRESLRGFSQVLRSE